MRKLRVHLAAWILAAATVACPSSPTPPPRADAGLTPPASTSSAAASAPASVPAPETKDDVIVGKAGRYVVTVGDFDRALRRLALFAPDRRPPTDVARAPHYQLRLVEDLLRLQVIRDIGEERGVRIPDEVIWRHLAEDPTLEGFFKLQPDTRQLELSRLGLSDADLLAMGRDRVLADQLREALAEEVSEEEIWQSFRELYEQRVLGYIEIPNTPTSQELDRYVAEHSAEIEAWFKEHPERFGPPAARRVRIILRRLPPGHSPAQRDEARRILEEVRGRVLAGEDFAILASQFSEHVNASSGGQLGWVVKRQMPEAFAAPVGQVSEVMLTPESAILLFVEEAQAQTLPELTPLVQREVAAELLRTGAPLPGPMATAREVLDAWRRAGRDGNPALERLLAERKLKLQKTPGFYPKPEQSPFIPGIGDAPVIVKAATTLTMDAWLHAEPVFIDQRIIVFGLQEFKEASRELYKTERPLLAEHLRHDRREEGLSMLVSRRLNDAGMTLDVTPIQTRYGIAQKLVQPMSANPPPPKLQSTPEPGSAPITPGN